MMHLKILTSVVLSRHLLRCCFRSCFKVITSLTQVLRILILLLKLTISYRVGNRDCFDRLHLYLFFHRL